MFDWPHSFAITNLKTGSRWAGIELKQEITKRADILRAAQVTPSSAVVIAHGEGEYFFADLLAVWACGATAVCLDEALTANEFANVLSFVEPSVFLYHGEKPAFRPPSLPAMDLAKPDVCKLRPAIAPGAATNAALILFTSGTTASPKAVSLSFDALRSRLSLNVETIGARALRRALMCLPSHFGHGLIGNALTPLFAGGELFIPERGLKLARSLGQIIDEHEITFMSSVPSFWHLVLNFGRKPMRASLQRVHVGSAPLAPTLWQSIVDWTGCAVWDCYGTTETANWIGGASSQDGISYGKIGRPWGGEIAVKRDDGTIDAIGEGPLVVRVPSIMTGYLKRPDLTSEVLIDGWYQTGDVGRIAADGTGYLTGRIKDEINRGGQKIQPAELDVLLETHPNVEEACAFGIPEAVSGEIIGAAVKLRQGSIENAATLREWCKARMRSYWVPDQWFFTESIPRNERGKVNREAVCSLLVREK